LSWSTFGAMRLSTRWANLQRHHHPLHSSSTLMTSPSNCMFTSLFSPFRLEYVHFESNLIDAVSSYKHLDEARSRMMWNVAYRPTRSTLRFLSALSESRMIKPIKPLSPSQVDLDAGESQLQPDRRILEHFPFKNAR
jgi:hypothetical protein